MPETNIPRSEYSIAELMSETNIPHRGYSIAEWMPEDQYSP